MCCCERDLAVEQIQRELRDLVGLREDGHARLHQEAQTRRPNFEAITGSPSDALQALHAGAKDEGKSRAVECTSPTSVGGLNQR